MGRTFSLRVSRGSSRWYRFITIMFLASGATTLFARPAITEAVRQGRIDSLFVLLAPGLFAVFLTLFVITTGLFQKRLQPRMSLMAFFFGALLLAVIVPETMREYNTRLTSGVASSAFFQDMLRSKDARVRALLVMSASCTTNSTDEWSQIIQVGLSDRDPLVREAAKYALDNRNIHHIKNDNDSLNENRGIVNTWEQRNSVAEVGRP